jgi:hypothetical protein
MIQLTTFLDTVLSSVCALECPEIVSFLDDDNHCMMCHSRLVMFSMRLERAEESIRAYREYVRNLQALSLQSTEDRGKKKRVPRPSGAITSHSDVGSLLGKGVICVDVAVYLYKCVYISYIFLGRDGDRIMLTEAPGGFTDDEDSSKLRASEPTAEMKELLARRCKLEMEDIPWESDSAILDAHVGTFLQLTTPSPSSNKHRDNIIQFTSKLIKKSLGAVSFEVGSVPLVSYLPDDDIYVSAVLCAGQELKWFVKLNEVFCTICSGYEEEEEEEEDGAEEDAFTLKDLSQQYKCKVEHVTFKNGFVKRLRCVVNGLVVDIRANAFGELCMMSMLEEVDNLVGKEHLFKKALLLTRYWLVLYHTIFHRDAIIVY